MTPETQVEPQVTVSTLAQWRDELRLQLHLATAEARTEWERYELKWKELERKLAAVETASVESAKGMRTAIQLLLHEIAEGYERIRRSAA